MYPVYTKSSKSNQNCLLPVWPLLRRGSFTPVSLRGLAAIRHPWRGAALAASMPLGPLRETCVQPAPKSRLAVFGLLRMKIKSNGNGNGNGNGFPAKAGPTMCALCQRSLIVPTLCVGMHPVTLRVTCPSLNARRLRDAERPGDVTTRSVGTIRVKVRSPPTVGPALAGKLLICC